MMTTSHGLLYDSDGRWELINHGMNGRRSKHQFRHSDEDFFPGDEWEDEWGYDGLEPTNYHLSNLSLIHDTLQKHGLVNEATIFGTIKWPCFRSFHIGMGLIDPGERCTKHSKSLKSSNHFQNFHFSTKGQLTRHEKGQLLLVAAPSCSM